jgi:hypothetical protein
MHGSGAGDGCWMVAMVAMDAWMVAIGGDGCMDGSDWWRWMHGW